MFDIVTKDEYFDWTDPKVIKSNKYSLAPSQYSLKGIQDAWILSLLENKCNLKMAEVGGGTSRVLKLLSHQNDCWNIDKFEGLGAGPLKLQELPGVKIVRSYMGDFDSEIPDNYFDIVFSISVIEHVPKAQLNDCFADCYRILKPGGLMFHAIDLYISDKPTSLTAVIDGYRQATEKPGFKWLKPPQIDNNTTFQCHYASNSDLTMSQWNRIAPNLREIRKTHQSVSIKLAAIKEGDDSLTQILLSTDVQSSAQQSSDFDNSVTESEQPQASKEDGSTAKKNVETSNLSANQDKNWLTVQSFLQEKRGQDEMVIAPTKFKTLLKDAYGYPKTFKISPQKCQWLIVHKGNLKAIDSGFMDHVVQDFKPVFANSVFVVFSSRSDLPALDLHSDHVLPLIDSLYPNQKYRNLGMRARQKVLGLMNQLNLPSSSTTDSSISSSASIDNAPRSSSRQAIQPPLSSDLSSLSRDQLLEQAAALRWFHAIDFGDYQSAGRFQQGQRQNMTLFPVFELLKGIQVKGMDCLDVGSACGLISFGLRSLGANRVAAADIVEFKTLRVANELLKANVEYYPGTRADCVSDTFPNQEFDLVVCAGVLYHMFNPMGAIAEARLLLRKNGLFVVETAYDPRRKDASMELNSESDDPFKEAYTYWNISESTIAGMLKICGFNILRCVRLKSPGRIAFLAQAVDYNDVENRTNLAKRMHELGFGEQKYISSKYPRTESNIQCDNRLADAVIDIKTYVTEFPHHVDFPKGGLGVSLYNPKQGDF